MINAERTVLALPRTDMELLVEEWLSDLRVKGRAAKTRHSYESVLSLFMRRTGVRTLEAFTDKAIKSYLVDIEDGAYPNMKRGGNSAATKHQAWLYFKCFCSWGIELENPPAFHSSLIDKRPGVKKWFRVPEPMREEKEIDPFTSAEVAKMELAAKRYQNTDRAGNYATDRRYMVLMHALLGTGMRLDEALRLEIDDLEENPFERAENDDARGFFRVRRNSLKRSASKTHRPRAVPVSAKLYRDLMAYLRERPSLSTKALFVDEDGRPMNQHAPQQYFQRLSERIGVHVHAHRFRHTFATDYLREHPHDIERLRLVLGHSDYTMIRKYVHFNLQMLGAGWNQGAPY